MGLKQTFQKSKVGNFPNSWSKTWPVFVFSGSHPIYSSIDWTENMNPEEVKKNFFQRWATMKTAVSLCLRDVSFYWFCM